MTFYGIKNYDGKWLTFGDHFMIEWGIDCWAFSDLSMAIYYAEENDAEVVPLVAKPALTDADMEEKQNEG